MTAFQTTARPRSFGPGNAAEDLADRLPPHDIGAEMALLGSMIIDPQVIGPVCMLVPTAEVFYKDEHKVLFTVVCDLFEKNVPIDALLLHSTLNTLGKLEHAGGYDYLKEILGTVPSAAHAEHYASIVREKAMLRKLITACTQTLKDAYESGEAASIVLDRGEKRIFDIAQQKISAQAVPLNEVLHETFEMLDRNTGEHYSGIPCGFIELDNLTSGMQRGEMIIVAARPSVGKCLAHDSQIVLQDGTVSTIEELYRARQGQLLTLRDDHRLTWTQPSHFIDDGIKQVFKVRTRLGKCIETTASHPFFTISGWKRLDALTPGDHVAVPRKIDAFGSAELPECEIKLLAYLLGDGGLSAGSPRFTNTNPAIQNEFFAAVTQFGGATATLSETRSDVAPSWSIVADSFSGQKQRSDFAARLSQAIRQRGLTDEKFAAQIGAPKASVHYWTHGRTVPTSDALSRICAVLEIAPAYLTGDDADILRKNAKSSVSRWLDSLGLLGKKSKDKFIPAPVFTLRRDLLAIFLNRLFSTDGWATVLGGGQTQLGFASVSETMIRQIQHLLLRFGVVASLRARSVKYKDTRRPAWQLDITDSVSIRTFIDEIGIFGKQEAVQAVRDRLNAKGVQTNCDLLPMGVWDMIEAAKGTRSWRSIAVAMGLDENNSLHVRRRRPSRGRLAQFAEVLACPQLAALATSDVYWDEIVSIEYTGEKQVYDLTIPDTHNFVANDICVHNTAYAMNIVEHVGVDLKKPCAVFSLEMSKQQLAQRMLCSRSGVDSHKLRRGMLSKQDRDKLSYAVGELSQGQIFIDDTPGLTLMDLRTKARRLKLQYGIELIVIDYLQLMEAPREENRQQQIASISRGVKALARELSVPVMCLSQLNRASESENRMPRTSDLRESGSIEQDADVVQLIHREAVMHRGDQEWMDANPDKVNEAQIIIAKQRNGPCDTVKLTFLSGQTRFVNYAPGI